jgi:FkbM family methyltransferase
MSDGDFTIKDYEQLNPNFVVEHAGHSIRYCTPSVATVWRAQSLMTKEPITVEWIDSFTEGAILVDVGANVGMYSMLAGVTRAAQVYAFEPESQNFALLCKNIVTNGLSERVRAWPAALMDVQAFSELHLSDFSIGGSCHSFGESVDFHLKPQTFPHIQGAISTTLDRLVADCVVPVPDHIKIDVDGFEHKVIAGARETLREEKVKSLLIEVNPHVQQHVDMILELRELGFTYDEEQVRAAARESGAFQGLAEYLFKRT